MLIVERREKVALALVARGAEPSLVDESREELDAALSAPPRVSLLDPEQAELRRALGVA